MVDTDDGGQQGQGRPEIRETDGIILSCYVQIFSVHHGVRSDLQFSELGNLDIDIIGTCPGAAEDRTPRFFLFQMTKQNSRQLHAFQ